MSCSKTNRHSNWHRPAARVSLLVLAWTSSTAGAITGGTGTTDFKNVGEGVQFTPNWVLTASHVSIPLNSTYSNGHGSAVVDAVYLAPGAGFPNNDLKLIHLVTPIAAAPVLQLSGTVFAPTALDWLNPSLNIDVTLSSNSNHAPRGYAFGQLREFVITYLDDHDNNNMTPPLLRTVNWFITHPNNFGAPYVQGGDSGGGLFLGHVTDHTSPLMGIGSALFSNVNGPNTFASAYVSVASYRSWIDSTMLANMADDQLANWVSTPVPEPATWALWLVGGAALLARARLHRT